MHCQTLEDSVFLRYLLCVFDSTPPPPVFELGMVYGLGRET